MKIIIAILFTVCLIEFTFCVDRDCLGCDVKPHTCNWAGCDYKGLTALPVEYNTIDSVHFAHPTMEYDSAENITLSIK